MDLNEFRQKNERGITNREFYEKAENEVLESKQAMIITIDKDDLVWVSMTGGPKTIMLGALEWAKHDVLGTIFEDDLD